MDGNFLNGIFNSMFSNDHGTNEGTVYNRHLVSQPEIFIRIG